MKNVKFGLFGLGLLAPVVAAVASLGAQSGAPFGFEAGRQVEPRMRTERPNLMMLDGRGSQLGVMVSDVDAKAATSGVKIDEVHEDSPAEKAGIEAGDLVVEYDGERVRSARQFTRLVQETPEGRTVEIALLRDGKKQTVSATPENGRMTWNFGPDVDRALREAERGMRGFRFDAPAPNFDFRYEDRWPRRFQYRVPDGLAPFMGRSRGRLGVTVQSLTPELEEYFGATQGGALVSCVARESAAAKAGIKPGDVIVSVNGRSVDDSDDLIQELEDLDVDVTIVVVRDKKEMTLKATLERPRPTTPRAGSRPGVVL